MCNSNGKSFLYIRFDNFVVELKGGDILYQVIYIVMY